MARDYRNPPKAKRGGHMWLGILVGIVIGIAVAAGLAWWLRDALRGAFQAPSPATSGAVRPEPPPKPIQPEVRPEYDFYQLLPQSGATGETTAAESPPASESQDVYYVQAGSFQNAQDADTLKARITLLGARVDIQSVHLPDRGLWHRVRLGPYASRAEAEITLKLLAENQIAGNILQIRDRAADRPSNEGVNP